MSRFTAEAYQNEYLPRDGSEVNAIVTVKAVDGGSVARPAGAAEIVIVDTSGSMAAPHRKIRAAREATATAIDCIRDGVAFGVIAGSHVARAAYPATGALVPASEQTRTEAKEAVALLRASGGTAIGSWLTLARELFGTAPGVHHAILLTDGQNEDETTEELDRVLAACEGRFQCDCRGVGTDWKVSELRRVASRLLGTAYIIPDPAGMAAEFRSLIETAMGKATHDVALRLWTPQGATVAFVRQVTPAIEELTDRALPVNELTADYPTGAWGDESRDYQLCIQVPSRGIGDEMLAGRLSVVVGGEVEVDAVGQAVQALIRAIWTDDEQLSTRINRQVAHYTGQAELAEAIQEGLDARKAGDRATATVKLGRAVQLAAESGNDDTMKLLQGVVEVDDAATGTVRLRRDVAVSDEMALDTRSTKTVRIQPTVP
jgi:VWA domain-containing protein